MSNISNNPIISPVQQQFNASKQVHSTGGQIEIDIISAADASQGAKESLQHFADLVRANN